MRNRTVVERKCSYTREKYIGCDIGKSAGYFNGKLRRDPNNKISEFVRHCLIADGAPVILEPSGGYEKRWCMRRTYDYRLLIHIMRGAIEIWRKQIRKMRKRYQNME